MGSINCPKVNWWMRTCKHVYVHANSVCRYVCCMYVRLVFLTGYWSKELIYCHNKLMDNPILQNNNIVLQLLCTCNYSHAWYMYVRKGIK